MSTRLRSRRSFSDADDMPDRLLRRSHPCHSKSEHLQTVFHATVARKSRSNGTRALEVPFCEAYQTISISDKRLMLDRKLCSELNVEERDGWL